MPEHEVVSQLASAGRLRAGLNMANFLLVSGKTDAGEPVGVAPDFAREIAKRLGVAISFVPFGKASEAGDAVDSGKWDIVLIGAEPARAAKIAFTDAYAEIEATYLVPPGSRLATISDVDRAGVRIAVGAGSAYDLWLTRNIAHAELVRAPNVSESYRLFADEKLDALAGLRPGLLAIRETLPGSQILEGSFTAVQQAVGTARRNDASAAFLSQFVEESKRSGLVAELIARHDIRGLTVAAFGRK